MRTVKYKIIRGIKYAYDMKSYWDKTQQKYRKKTTYLGKVIDEEKGTYEKKKRTLVRTASIGKELILNYGDSHIIDKCVTSSRYSSIFKKLLPKHNDEIMSLLCYKLISASAMNHAETWYRGNYASMLYPKSKISSQRISELLKELGDEREWRQFFNSYIKKAVGKEGTAGIMIDSTGMPNEISFPLSAWSNHGGECERETRLVMVLDKDTKSPLYFRYVAGNIVDVSSLSNTIAELNETGVKTRFALVDAGYYSQSNITELYDNNISFLTRLPAGRKLYKNLLSEHSADMEKVENMVSYGKRALFIKRVKVELFSHTAYAYIVCDIRRKADELTKAFIAAQEDGISNEEFNDNIPTMGKFVLISSEELKKEEVMPLYYTRQYAENLFGISKNNLDLLPLRVHSIETFRGYLMLNFLALIVYTEMNKRLGSKYTVEEALMEMANLKCKVYDDKIIPAEPTKKAKQIMALFNTEVI